MISRRPTCRPSWTSPRGGERACGWICPDGRGPDGRASLFNAGCGMAPPRGRIKTTVFGRSLRPGTPYSAGQGTAHRCALANGVGVLPDVLTVTVPSMPMSLTNRSRMMRGLHRNIRHLPDLCSTLPRQRERMARLRRVAAQVGPDSPGLRAGPWTTRPAWRRCGRDGFPLCAGR